MKEPIISSRQYFRLWTYWKEDTDYMAYIICETEEDGSETVFAVWEDMHGGGEVLCGTVERAKKLLEDDGFHFVGYTETN